MQAGGTSGAGEDPGDIDDGTIEPEVLAFANEDERLPWLEGDDDAEEPGVDTGRVIAFVVGALILLGVVIGGLWWAFRDRSDSTMVADGSTIHAPAQPYKTRPANPGGAEALGTGDTSFAVAEGQEPTSRVADESEPLRPSIDRNQPDTAAPAEEAPKGVGVQVGAYSSRDRAEAGWSTLSTRYPALSGVGHRIVQGTVDGSPIFRLQALAGDVKAAAELCNAVRQQGGDCQVKN
jgi:hypothetical protein